VAAGRGWSAKLFVNKNEALRFDDHGGNPLLQALWRLPKGVAEARARARGEATAEVPGEGLPCLRVTDGLLAAARKSQAAAPSLEGEFVTRELGRIKVRGEATLDPAGFVVTLQVYPFAGGPNGSAEIVLPALKRREREDAARVEKAKGLRIIILLGAQAPVVQEPYIEDLVEVWRRAPSDDK